MLNFYRRFLPHAAATQAPLHTLLAGPRTKGSQSINWTPVLRQAFEECKASLSRAAMIAHPDVAAPIALVTDASTTAMGAVLQQRTQNTWQPLAFFSKKMSTAQQKYSAYDRELLAIYEAVKHFRHMLEARHFVIFTDHKPLTYAFSQKRDKCTPRQFNHFDYISQFTTDIRHISGQENVVADALSRVEAVCTSVSPEALPEAQATDFKAISGPSPIQGPALFRAQPFSGPSPFQVPALFRAQLFSGPSTPTRADQSQESLFRPMTGQLILTNNRQHTNPADRITIGCIDL